MFTFKFLSQVNTRFSQIGQNQNLKKYDFVMPFYFNKSYTKSICWLAVLKYKLQLHILFDLRKLFYLIFNIYRYIHCLQTVRTKKSTLFNIFLFS